MKRHFQRSVAIFAARPRLLIFAKIGLVYAAVWTIMWFALDPDFGWHLQAGNYYREHGIPAHDIFTYTAPNFEWINHEWASDFLVSLLFGWGGYLLLAICFAAIWTAAIFVNAPRARLVVALSALLAMSSFMAVRPVAWTVLGFAVFIRILAAKTHSPKAWDKNIWFLPLLILLWANLHGGFITGLALIGYFMLKYRSRRLAIIFVISVLATLANPYGIRVYEEIIRTLADNNIHSQVVEWKRFRFGPNTWAFIVLWLLGFWLFYRNKLRNYFGLGPLMLVAAASAARHIPLFIVTTISEVDESLTRIKKTLPKRLNTKSKLLIMAGVVVLWSWLGYAFWRQFHNVGDREQHSPSQAAAYLAEHGCSGRLFNEYNFGGYLIWKAPSVPVYVDGRMPSWTDEHGKTYIERFFNVVEDEQVQKAEFARYNIKCALLFDKRKVMIERLELEGWQAKVDEGASVLLVKE